MVSPIGLGTVKLGRNVGVKYPGEFQIPDDAAAADLLRAAQKLGVTLLDTAPAYGEAEERLGRILGACGGRDRWRIITKAGEEFDAATGESRFDFSPGAIEASIERSLKRLRTNRLDVALLHSDGRDEWILRESGALDALAKMKRKRVILAAGISTKTPEGAMLAATLGPECGCDVLMATLNSESCADLPAIREAGRRGMGVFIKKVFASGHAVADGRTSESLRAALTEPAVSCVVIGTINASHLAANIAMIDGITLPGHGPAPDRDARGG